jgi:hydrophobe/amphiphile efflux-1 (HAE1) family protein
MNISEGFIRRPIATSLLMLGLLVFGASAYTLLPVAALPDTDFPTISVSASLPGASPETMASTIATPLEQQFAAIPGLAAMTSWSGLGFTSITLQFALGRSIDGAATDVQTAINAAGGVLPKDLPTPPTYHKVNTTDQPVLIYAVHSDDMPLYKVDDYAYTVLAQKISAVPGVAQVAIAGQQDFAVRIRANPAALASHGISMEDLRQAIAAATINQAKGTLEGRHQSFVLDANDQLFRAQGYRDLIVAFRNGAPVRVRDIAEVVDGARLPRTGAWYNGKRAEVLLVYRQPGANTVRIVDQVRALLPELLASVPPSLRLDVVSDRSHAIEASIADVKFTLVLTIGLVVMVILLFLRHFWATVIPSIAVPLALVGTFALMYLLGYSVNNLTLMALTIAVGFVVDDAIVMLENIVRYIEKGDPPFEAALKGAGEIGFTIVSITFSLVAVFIPMLLMSGMVGVLFREFAVTVTAAVIMSAFVSLTLTPVMCARFLHQDAGREQGRIDRMFEHAFAAVQRGYDRGLVWVLDHQKLTLAATVALAVLTGWLYAVIPKGLFPAQDTGFVFATVEGREDMSFQAMVERQNQVSAALLRDPATLSVVGFAGTGSIVPSENLARLFVQLKPYSKRDVSAQDYIQRIRPAMAEIQGVNVYLQASQDLTFGGRLSRTQYQYTLTSLDTAELYRWAPILNQHMRGLPKLQDNASDQQNASRHLAIEIDRDTASRLGISAAAIDQTLYDTFGERQVATIYSPTTQYKVLLESTQHFEHGPVALSRLYVPGANGVQVPLSAVARFVDKVAPLTINHQGQFPAVTLSFNLAPGAALSEAVEQIHRLREELKVPPTIDGSFQGIARVFEQSLKSTPLLVAAAIFTVYIVLGMLYESYIHPITILSALPSAGVGALLALMLFGYDLSVIALIGIILLIGIVKKNAIMMIDFALKAEREQGLSPREAIHQACLLRFRPIMMTTLAAIGGGLPLALSQGAGSELRNPLGVSIVGGLLVSQWLTLYTTPVVYLYLDRLSHWLAARTGRRRVAAE